MYQSRTELLVAIVVVLLIMFVLIVALSSCAPTRLVISKVCAEKDHIHYWLDAVCMEYNPANYSATDSLRLLRSADSLQHYLDKVVQR